MGKASSSKKVARAAGIGGGRAHRRQTPWGYFGVIGLILVLGIAGTVASRDRRLAQINSNGNTPPTIGTVWNEGYAVFECGKFLPPISSSRDPQGIHTQSPGDGIIHIAPNVKAAAGKNATLGKFASAVGMKLNAAELQVPGTKQYLDGDACEGKPGHVYVKQFQDVDDTVGKLYNGVKYQLPRLDPRNVPLEDQALLTIAFVPADDASSIPPPPQRVIANLEKLEPSSSSTTTLPHVARRVGVSGKTPAKKPAKKPAKPSAGSTSGTTVVK